MGAPLRYVFVGKPSRRASTCGASPNGIRTPNGNYAADQIASWLAHALNEVLTDPYAYAVTHASGYPLAANSRLLTHHGDVMETNGTQRAVLACSLFLHTGYIGAVTVAAGLIQVLAGEASGLGLVVFGAILATSSWRRAWTVVAAGDPGSVVKGPLRGPICEPHRTAAKYSGEPAKAMGAA
jgi:hypothetical protein